MWITTNCGKFLKRREYQTILPISWETCMWIKKQQLEPDKEQRIGSKLGKRVHQGCVLSPCLFNFYAEYVKRNARLDESQAGIKIARRNINNLRYADDITLMAESEEELKELLNELKEKREKWLKSQHSKNKLHLVPSLHGKWKGEKWNQWQVLFSWAPKSLRTHPWN